MTKVNSWMKFATFSILFFTCMMVLTACNEEHPDNQPGAVNNPYPELSVAATSSVAIDPADSTMKHSIPVTFNVAAPAVGTFNFKINPGTALEGRDYTIESQQVSFNKGDRQANIEIVLVNDVNRSQDREFRLELTSASNATLTNNINHAVTIEANSNGGNDDDTPITPSVLELPANKTLVAPVAGEAQYAIVLPLSKRLVNPASVSILSQDGTAKEGIHYRPLTASNCNNGVCHLAAGAAELVFFIPVIGQKLNETRNFKLQFIAAEGLNLGTQREVEITLNYSETETIPTSQTPNKITLRMPTAARGTATYPVVVPLSSMLQNSASLAWRTVDNSARAGVHYTLVDATGENSSQLHAGQQEIEFSLQLLHDQATTENVSFNIQLVSAHGLTLPNERNITVDIVHSNESVVGSYPRVFYPNEFVVQEGAGEKSLFLPLSLSEKLPDHAELGLRFINGTASEGLDFEVVTENLTINKGSGNVLLPILLKHNLQSTAEGSFTVELHSPLNIDLPVNNQFQVRIIDAAQASPEPQLTLSPQIIKVPVPRWNVPENITLYFPLTDDAAAASINVASRSGTALAGVDFESAVTTSINGAQLNVGLTLLPQELSSEPREFELLFTQATGLRLPENRLVTIQIEPRDMAALPSVMPPGLGEVEFNAPTAGGSTLRKLVLPFSNVAPLAGNLTLFVESGTAEEGVDFTLTTPTPSFSIGAQEVIIELDVMPSAKDKKFRLILESAENLVLPTDYEQRILKVSVL